MAEEQYANIRTILGPLIGKRLKDITQHDKDEFEESGACYVMLMFEDGSYVQFDARDGFHTNVDWEGEDAKHDG